MQRRLAHSPTKTPTLTGGDDRPETPCQRDLAARREHRAQTGEWIESPFDILMDHTTASATKLALAQARTLCGSCPVMAACIKANRGEPWMQMIVGVDGRKQPEQRPECGTNAGYHIHSKSREHACQPCRDAHWQAKKERDAAHKAGTPKPRGWTTARQGRAVTAQGFTANREDSLRTFDASGVGITEACRRLGVTRSGLQKWCRNHGLRDLYRSLCARETVHVNGWMKGDVA